MLRTATMLACLVLAAFANRTSIGADLPPVAPRSGSFHIAADGEKSDVPQLFRLSEATVAWQQKYLPSGSDAITMSEVTFPSAVKTPFEVNNTVACEYYRPTAAGKYPAVIVLHILGGDFNLSRLFARQLAHQHVAALFVKMPYYGPRRPPNSSRRMISKDPAETVEGMQQAVLDVRYATAWLADQKEVDPARLGIFGISLGGITSALAATAEPRIQNVCLMLAGGDIGQVAWESRELKKLRDEWTAKGGTKEQFLGQLHKIDPVTYADRVRGKRIFMLNASHDEVIPRACTDSLWQAFGKPPIEWMDAGHYSAMRFLPDGLAKVTRFFQAGGVK